MRFQSAEDRLNPVPPPDADEATLGGYTAIHGRAAAFEGADGQPYTVGIEAEAVDAPLPWTGYLVFLRWAANGTAIMGHVETEDLVQSPTEKEARDALERLPLSVAKQILDETARRKEEGRLSW